MVDKNKREMRTERLFAMVVVASTLCACGKYGYVSSDQNAFTGHYAPQMPIGQERVDLDEEGIEASTASQTYYNHWSWNVHRRLTRVYYDVDASYYVNHPVHDDYYYDAGGRIDSLKHVVEGASPNSVRTYKFHYDNGLLSCIKNKSRITEFRYRCGSRYPYAIAFVRPLEQWLRDLYHTDTLVQTWTLEWRDGNLMRATGDSMAWYCTGLSHIDYFYDDGYNPLQGHYTGDLIGRDAFIDDPACLCRNNLVRRVMYHCDSLRNIVGTTEHTLTYSYRSDGYPLSVATSYNSMYWTVFNIKSTYTYLDHVNEE